ncbi:MAG: hypothetical protein C5B55_08620 [Blastocatellia bacterium]|nr:MAG: hypothetical protein C5B55_08620 [Blastocatellia bacterium]
MICDELNTPLPVLGPRLSSASHYRTGWSRAIMQARVVQNGVPSVTTFARESSSAEDGLLVFLFGLPRSGTTWVGKIFDSHPRTVYKHEPDSFPLEPTMPWAPAVSDTEALRPAALRFLSLLPNINSSRAAGSLPIFPKEYRSDWQSWMHCVSILGTKLISRVFAKELPVLPCCDYDSAFGLRLVWKSINSLGRLGVFFRVANHRKAIVVVRHPCGVIASLKRGLSRGNLRNNPSEDYSLFEMLTRTDVGKRYGLTVSKLQRMQSDERLTWKWVVVHEKAFEDVGDQQDVLFVRYEDICNDPAVLTLKMFDFCGLPWSMQTERFLETSTKPSSTRLAFRKLRSSQLSSDYFAIHKGPVQSATRWHSELQPDEIRRICDVLNCSSLARLYPST